MIHNYSKLVTPSPSTRSSSRRRLPAMLLLLKINHFTWGGALWEDEEERLRGDIFLNLIKRENTEELSQNIYDWSSSSSNVDRSDDDGLDGGLYSRQTTASHVSPASYDQVRRFLVDFTWNAASCSSSYHSPGGSEQDLWCSNWTRPRWSSQICM